MEKEYDRGNEVDNKPVEQNENLSALIGMLCWESNVMPFAEIPGELTNPDTFKFPIRYRKVKGANFKTIVEEPNRVVLESMKREAKVLEKEGARGLLCDCGFNAIFQRDLANSVDVPFFTSSLMLVPLVYHMLKEGQKVGIITAHAGFLGKEHLQAVGIDSSIPVSIVGLEDQEEWLEKLVCNNPPEDPSTINFPKLKKELLEVATGLVKENPEIGALVLECSTLPGFASAIQDAVHLPIFDGVTLTNMMYEAISRKSFDSRI